MDSSSIYVPDGKSERSIKYIPVQETEIEFPRLKRKPSYCCFRLLVLLCIAILSVGIALFLGSEVFFGEETNAVIPEGRNKYKCTPALSNNQCLHNLSIWYFDGTSCRLFPSGLCNENENNFESLEECSVECENDNIKTNDKKHDNPNTNTDDDNNNKSDDKNKERQKHQLCFQQKDSGPCRANMLRFYFDRDEETCKEFIYGGCNGNSNNFASLDECLTSCGRLTSKDDTCDQPMEVGPCKSSEQRWHYDSSNEQCVKFDWSGCGGNDNNFASKHKCEERCLGSYNLCSLPPQMGLCRSLFPRYFHNSKSGECERFIYGGCDGNDNNFESVEECRLACPKFL